MATMTADNADQQPADIEFAKVTHSFGINRFDSTARSRNKFFRRVVPIHELLKSLT